MKAGCRSLPCPCRSLEFKFYRLFFWSCKIASPSPAPASLHGGDSGGQTLAATQAPLLIPPSRAVAGGCHWAKPSPANGGGGALVRVRFVGASAWWCWWRLRCNGAVALRRRRSSSHGVRMHGVEVASGGIGERGSSRRRARHHCAGVIQPQRARASGSGGAASHVHGLPGDGVTGPAGPRRLNHGQRRRRPAGPQRRGTPRPWVTRRAAECEECRSRQWECGRHGEHGHGPTVLVSAWCGSHDRVLVAVAS